MPNSTTSSRRPSRRWRLPLLSAAAALVVGVFGNLLANDLEKLLGPNYRWIVWGIFAVAAIIAIIASIREARRNEEHSQPERNVTIGGGVTNSTIIAGDNNVAASLAKNISAPVATGDHGRAVQTSTYIERQIIQSESLLNALHQLPAPPRDFTGREAELKELLAKMETGVVTISGLQGMGGIGKTALALKLAERLAPHYPDAQFCFQSDGADNLKNHCNNMPFMVYYCHGICQSGQNCG